MDVATAKDIALNRTPTEIFVAHNAIAVYMAISEHATSLNASRFKQTLGSVQHHALGSFILSICTMYEKPNKYPNYSIPTALAILKNNAQSLAAGIQNPVTLVDFIRSHIDSAFSESDVGRIPTLLLDFFSDHCAQTPPRKDHPRDDVLYALKVLRDKRVAHHEAINISGMSETDLDGALDLLAFAKSFVNLVGYGLFGFSTNGWTCASEFAPQESVLWGEIQELVGTLA